MAVYCPLPPQPWYRGLECYLEHGCVTFVPFRYKPSDRPLPPRNTYVRTSKIRTYALTPGEREALPGIGLQYHINI